MAVGPERMRQMGLDDFGGAVPVARIEYVNRPLFEEGTGVEVVGKILLDRVQVSNLHPRRLQRQAVNAALSLLSAR